MRDIIIDAFVTAILVAMVALGIAPQEKDRP